jgi:hypothetical protein
VKSKVAIESEGGARGSGSGRRSCRQDVDRAAGRHERADRRSFEPDASALSKLRERLIRSPEDLNQLFDARAGLVEDVGRASSMRMCGPWRSVLAGRTSFPYARTVDPSNLPESQMAKSIPSRRSSLPWIPLDSTSWDLGLGSSPDESARDQNRRGHCAREQDPGSRRQHSLKVTIGTGCAGCPP